MAQSLTSATSPVVGSQVVGSQLVLYDIAWETYEKLLEVFSEQSTLRMTYYKGTLELMTPLPEHERYSWTLSRLVVALSEELNLEILGLKSTTWHSQPQAIGKEADECFYIQNEASVRGKLKIDLMVDPPPDLAIEVDMSHSSLDKMAVYAELKVPEVWHWQPGKLTINILTNTGYVVSKTSLAFGALPVEELGQFMRLDSQKGENARLREFRQ